MAEPRPWSWPPQEVSLLHLQQGLRKVGVAPDADAHAAWHSRAGNLAATKPNCAQPQQVSGYLSDVAACVRDGLSGGWLDGGHPAFDGGAQGALSASVDDALSKAPSLWHFAAMSGDWGALTVAGKPLASVLNPAALAADQAEGWAEIEAKMAGIRGGDMVAGDVLAGRMAHVIEDTMSAGCVPALVPRDLPKPARQALLDNLAQRWPSLSDPGHGISKGHSAEANLTPAQRASLWVNRCRLQPDETLTRKRKQAAFEALYYGAKDLGYDAIETAEDAYAVLDNGWSPAEARASLRRARKAKAGVVDAYRQRGAFAAGVKMAAAARTLRSGGFAFVSGAPGADIKKEIHRVWTGSLALPVMEDAETQSMLAGFGATVLNFAPPDMRSEWAAKVRQGYSPRLGSPQQLPTRVAAIEGSLHTALVRQGVALPSDRVIVDPDVLDMCWIQGTGSQGSVRAVRIVQSPDGNGSLRTQYEMDADVMQSPFFGTWHGDPI